MELDSNVQILAEQGKTKEDIRVYSVRQDITKSWFRIHIAVDCNRIKPEYNQILSHFYKNMQGKKIMFVAERFLTNIVSIFGNNSVSIYGGPDIQ